MYVSPLETESAGALGEPFLLVDVDVDFDMVVDGALDSSATFDVDVNGGARVHGAVNVNVNDHVNLDALVDG